MPGDGGGQPGLGGGGGWNQLGGLGNPNEFSGGVEPYSSSGFGGFGEFPDNPLSSSPVLPTYDDGSYPDLSGGKNSDTPDKLYHYTDRNGRDGIKKSGYIDSPSGTNYYTDQESNDKQLVPNAVNKDRDFVGYYGPLSPKDIPDLYGGTPVDKGMWKEWMNQYPVPVDESQWHEFPKCIYTGC